MLIIYTQFTDIPKIFKGNGGINPDERTAVNEINLYRSETVGVMCNVSDIIAYRGTRPAMQVLNNVRYDKLVLPNYIFTYNGNQYVRVTPFAYSATDSHYKFGDGSDIGRAPKVSGNESNYRFFEIQPIKWIVLNYNYLPSQYGTGGGGSHTRLELLANDVLVSGVPFDDTNDILWHDSLMKKYLNTTFNKEVLSAESELRQTSSVVFNNIDNSDINLNSTGSNINYLESGSNPTTQKLYLLSYFETFSSLSNYITNGVFGTNNVPDVDKRLANATDYAKAHILYVNPENEKVEWWLRSTDGVYPVRVLSGGTGGANGITFVHSGTRPAMQVVNNVLFDK